MNLIFKLFLLYFLYYLINFYLYLIALGYSLEKVILYCTSLGLGTVWLGGTFNKGNFAKAVNLKENEILPIVSPVGYEGGKKSLFAKVVGKILISVMTFLNHSLMVILILLLQKVMLENFMNL